MPTFDFCVIGAGSAGFNAAQRARELGKSVAIVEREGELAGLCILRGCMPAKTVLRSAQIAHEIAEAPKFGIEPADATVRPRAIVQRKRRVVREFAEERVKEIESFPLFRGTPRFVSPNELEVGKERITASRFLIATGSRILPPPVSGIAECGFLTSDDALEMTTLPKSLLILGGGPVGCEFAQYFGRLGVSVTLLQDAGELLMNEDPDVGKAVREALEADGVDVVVSARFEKVGPCDAGKRIDVEVDGRMRSFEAADIFVAMNRRANVAGLELETAGVRFDLRGIVTDEFLRTSNPAIYAAGDVTGRRMLVHFAEFGGRMAASNAFAESPCPVDFDLFEARSVYTQPEVAVAGLSEWQCRERGIDYEAESYPFSDHGRAITMDLPEGFVKVIAARDGRILGITIVGGESSDFIHEAVALLYFKASVYDISNMPHLHPTMAEVLTWPADALTQRLGLQEKLICGIR